ncbi:hypothetical protein AVEN_2067-1 [Araneus ventricosus]|uniref:Uncharacterized protein n=1 Tax=Araneus ventricosus TaxID=182803 RepID=A0A4Y2T9J9_ARAVE|nr:hypothetical protein AVEN_2067-1 [Araneus ventricosus]
MWATSRVPVDGAAIVSDVRASSCPEQKTRRNTRPNSSCIKWVAVSSTVGLRIERRHHLQSVCLQDVVLVDQTDENRWRLSLVGQCYNIHRTAQT